MGDDRNYIFIMLIWLVNLNFSAGKSEKISYHPTPRSNVSKVINYKSYREQQLIRSLLSNYQKTERPPGLGAAGNLNLNASIILAATNLTEDDPVNIFASIHILSLSSFNDVTMTFTCQFRLRQEWNDVRLAYNDTYFRSDEFLILAEDQRIWEPDTFFQNEQSGHEHLIDKANVYLKFRADGRVKYSKRLTMAFSCPMNLLLFPHDTQTCYIDFASYAYTSTDILYVWDNPSIEQLASAIDAMPKFSVEGLDNSSCTQTTATGTYSCLRVVLRLRREVSFFLLQLYLPSCMMVAVGCVSFWIDWRSAPARVPLAIVTLLTITTQAHGINSNLPPVSYTKAIDVWIGACVVFIFGALLEFAVVNYVGTNEEKRKAKWRDYASGNVFKNFLTSSSSTKCPNRNGVSPEMNSTNDPNKRHLRHRRTARNRTKSSTIPSSDGNPHNNNAPPPRSMMIDEESRGDCFDAHEYVAYRKSSRMSSRTYRKYRNQQHRGSLMIDLVTAASDRDAMDGCAGGGGDDGEMMHTGEAVFVPAPNDGGTMAPPSNATRAERIDMVSRVLFPAGFLLFNVVYWALYIPLLR